MMFGYTYTNIYIVITTVKLIKLTHLSSHMGLLRWLSGKESTCQVGDTGSILGSGRYPREGNGNTLHYSCLENPIDRGAWWATIHGVAKSWT